MDWQCFNMIDVVSMAEKEYIELKEYVEKNHLHNISLDIIQIGDNQASNSYIRGKIKDCQEVGIKCNLWKFEETCTTDDVLYKIGELKFNTECHGIIVQLPVPKHIDVWKLTLMIPYDKDVDGFKNQSMYTPCTPKGVMFILDKMKYDLYGKSVCIIGKSEIVGKPLIGLMLDKSATVISCNSKTKDISFYTKNSDVIVSCAGKENLITKSMVRKDSVIIDVGINYDSNGNICGDCSKELYEYVKNITPVPKGCGLTTRLMLLQNVIYGAQNNEKNYDYRNL